MQLRVWFSLCFLTQLLFGGSATAGVLLSAGDVTLVAGGATQLVDVNIRWVPEAGEQASVNIDNFSASFVVTPVGTPGSSVTFAAYSDGPIIFNGDHQLADPNYLFFDNSLNIELAQHSGVLDAPDNTMFIGSDGRFDLGRDTILDANTRLLMRFELRATGTSFGETFFALKNVGTVFFDNSQNEIAFQEEFGSIRVTAVPEPSSAMLLLIAVASTYGPLWCKRKRSLGAVSNLYPASNETSHVRQ